MATDENLNNTDTVLSTDTPQSSQSTQNGANGSDFQSTASPEEVKPGTDVSVQTTGEPVTANTTPVDSSINAGPYVFGGVLLAVIIAGVVLVMRVKDFSGGSSTASLLKSETDVPKTSKKPAAKKSPAKKAAAARKATAKKTTKKRPAASRKKRR